VSVLSSTTKKSLTGKRRKTLKVKAYTQGRLDCLSLGAKGVVEEKAARKVDSKETDLRKSAPRRDHGEECRRRRTTVHADKAPSV